MHESALKYLQQISRNISKNFSNAIVLAIKGYTNDGSGRNVYDLSKLTAQSRSFQQNMCS